MDSTPFRLQARTQRVCVMGLGYVGLPTAAILAAVGYRVHGTDLNPKVVENVMSAEPRLVEPHLGELVRQAVKAGRLTAQTAPATAEVYLICVPTPCGEHHEPDLRYVFSAVDMICPLLKKGDLVVLESTVPPRTTEQIADVIAQKAGLRPPEIMVAHAPERILPGRALEEAVRNARIVGGIDVASTQACAAFYRSFVTGELHCTDSRTAETAKLLENAYRDVNVAFANEASLLADELRLDVWELIRLANQHPRVRILSPGAGVGGHCIAVDPWFLVAQAPHLTKLIQAARNVNDYKADWVVQRVLRRAERIKEPRIACLGLAYKPDVDDVRESPAVKIVHALVAAGIGQVRVVEPYLLRHPDFELSTLQEALADADIVVILVAHSPFRQIPPSLLAERIVIDVCGVLQPVATPAPTTAAEPPAEAVHAGNGNGNGKIKAGNGHKAGSTDGAAATPSTRATEAPVAPATDGQAPDHNHPAGNAPRRPAPRRRALN